MRGLSADVLPGFELCSFDLIHIDGSHCYGDVLADLRMAHRLLRDGGILCGDDLELQASECDRHFAGQNKHLDYREDPRTGRPFHPGVTLAVYEFFGPVSALYGFWAMRKTGSGYQGVLLRGENTLIPEHFPDDAKAECAMFLAAMREAFTASTGGR